MSEKLRVALCGAGDFGPQFSRYIAEFAELVAVCDPGETARNEFAANAGEDPRDVRHGRVLADGVEQAER